MTRRIVFPALLAAQLVALAPSWSWYATRLADPSDSPSGVLAVAAVAGCAALRIRRGDAARMTPVGWMPVLFTALAVGLQTVAPPLLRLLVAVAAIAAMLSQRIWRHPFHPGLAVLCWLAIPILPSAQFYLGYPLRAASACVCAAIFRALGFSVLAEGAALHFGGAAEQIVWFDAPCSGVHMLWGAMFCTGTLLLAYDLRGVRATAAILGTIALTLFANVIRGIYLALLELTLHGGPAAFHQGVGLATTGSALLAAFIILRHLPKPAVSGSADPQLTKISRLQASTLSAVCLAGLLLQLHSSHSEFHDSTPESLAAVAWPNSFEGQSLTPGVLTVREERFAADFPGQTRRFLASDGREVVIRVIDRPTRKLHSAADCLRGAGFSVFPRPAERGGNGSLESCIDAVRGTDRLEVCEYVVDRFGQVSGDVSAWFWHATLNPENGPWFSYVISRNAAKSGIKNTL